jgi:lipopolysaccharide transport system ATP-binding protein
MAIRVEGVSKRYLIGNVRDTNRTLRDVIANAIVAPIRRAVRLIRGNSSAAADLSKVFWALRDVSFDIKRGEIVGLIGANGAGKSTLLKILSRITAPTSGFVEVCGRVGSLLEVGTGFHPELTGHENIYLNGAILGMRRADIKRRYDEIVAFAEVEEFIDTPVKHYSSGMYLRLAFAVAAHLEPEILLVDEVLAVGDMRFQKKCLNKMQGVGQEGRTVVFVSHNLQAVSRLCERVILLDQGRVARDGPAHDVISEYLNTRSGTTAVREWPEPRTAPAGDVARLRAVRVRAEDGRTTDSIDIRHPIGVEMEYDVLKPGAVLMPNLHFSNEEGVHAFSAHDLDPEWRGRPRPPGCYVSTVWIPGNLLSEGTMFVGAGFETIQPPAHQFWEPDVVAFHVIDSINGDTARGDYAGRMTGIVRPLLKWTTRCLSSAESITEGYARAEP